MSSHRARWIATVALTAALCATGAARADHVQWSVGIQAPLGNGASIGTVFGNGGVAPMVVAAPVYVPAPRPVYVPAPPVYVAPAPVYYEPEPVYVPRRVVVAAPVWVAGRWVWPHREHHHHGDWDRGHDVERHSALGAPVYVPRALRSY